MRVRNVTLGGRADGGQTLVEIAIVFPLLLLVVLGLLQLAIYYHAQNVVEASVQEGVRVAASEDRTLGDGVSRTESLLQAGLGQSAGGIRVEGVEGPDQVAIQATGSVPAMVPLPIGVGLPLRARGLAERERFRAGP